MRTLIIDTDIGVDDAFALAYAARTQRRLGITTVFGNVAVGQAVKNARLFCQKMAIETEAYRGCSRPLTQRPSTPATLHGEDGLGDAFDNKFSEFNIWKDPHAADQVLKSALKVVVIPLDVTHQVLVTGDEVQRLNQPVLSAICRPYLAYSLAKEGFVGMAVDADAVRSHFFQTLTLPAHSNQ
ncbi:nucleoside hydrolase [Pantoea sp. Eser]|nr:nucleoside hydrolase [Pantoea sp. Eser]